MRAQVAVVSIVVLGAALAAPAGATFKGRNGDLAFTARVQEVGPCHDMLQHFDCGPIYGNLFLAGGARQKARRATPCDARQQCDVWGPAWSPDGGRLAFTSGGTVYVARADGTHPRKVAEDSTSPAWSPGGRELAVARDDGIYRLRLSDGRLARVTSGQDRDPDWSSLGRIAFVRASPTEVQGIYTVDARGGNLKRLTTSYDFGPSWAPDGKTVAYHRGSILYLQSTDGKVRTIPSIAGPGAWSPDGRLLAAPTSRRISVFRPSGALVRAVRVPRGYVTGVAWQPRR
jgi:Tol biopolymer transport system component